MSNLTNKPALPSSMEQKLRSILRRQAILTLLRAVAIGAAVLIAAMVFAMIIDWGFTLFSTGVRTVLTVSSILLAVAALVGTLIPRLLTLFRWTRAANNVDEEIPELEERWTTVASFSESDHQPKTEAEKAMLRQVTSEAVAMGQLVRPAQVVRPTVLRPAGLALGVCGLGLAVFLSINWSQTSILLQRFWSPTANITATQLESLTGNMEIPRGEPLDLVTRLTGLSRGSAMLEMKTGNEIFDTFELKPDEDQENSFVHHLTVNQSFRYRTQSGDGRTPWHTVTVIDYPGFGEVQFIVSAPEYVDRPTFEKTLIPSRVKVIQGSQLDLRIKPIDVLDRLELLLTIDADNPDEEPTEKLLTLTPDADGWYQFETQLLKDISLRPILFNSHGLTNEDRHVCRIQVIPDKAPVARIITPTDEMVVAVDDVIEIKFEAHDDHGIATAELVVYDESATKEGGEPKIISRQPIPLDDQQLEKHILATTQLDLSKLNIEKGKNISYAIRVTDNRMVKLNPIKPEEQIANLNQEDLLAPNSSEAVRPQSELPRDDLENMLADASDLVRKRSDGGDRSGEVSDKNEGNPSTTSSGNNKQKSRESDDSEPAKSSKKNGENHNNFTDTNAAKDEDKDSPSSQGTSESRTQNAVIESKSNNETTEGDSPTSESIENKETAIDSGKPMKEGDVPSNDQSGDSSPSSDNPAESVPLKSKDETAVVSKDDNTGSEENSSNKEKPLGKNSQKDSNSKQSRDIATDSQDSEESKNNKIDMSENGERLEKMIAMIPQQSESGQNTETNRRMLKITDRLSSVAAATNRKVVKIKIRDRVIQIDKMLAEVETALTEVINREIADADRSEQFRLLDTGLGEIETYVAELRNETKGEQIAFVGLQMVHINRTHVTPARDRVFIAIREPIGTDNPTIALHHIVRSREMLAALLNRYDRVARDEELAKSLDKTVRMYEVYVEKMQQLMRERRQNRNPLDRKMAVIEVDQDYLDRYAEVLTLRREMMAEFGRMLGDDPRLLARYLDIVRRRRSSLRAQLTELFDRQDEISMEVSGWLQVGKDQRDDLWTIVAEMRLQAVTPLAKEAAGLAERVEQAMPLVLKTDEGTSALVIEHAQQLSRLARSIALEAKAFEQPGEQPNAARDFAMNAEHLTFLFTEFDAALEQLNFENESVEEISEYVDTRLLESRIISDQADEWAQVAVHIQQKRYNGLAEVDQQKLAIATELLRVEMLNIESDLESQFEQQAESELPGEIVDMIRELHRVMEGITFNQTAATFALTEEHIEVAELQQAKTIDGFERAEKLFDLIRRAVVTALDEYDIDDPNIADLQDPTLDEFLARLEREPNIEAQLGIPNRRRNLRVIAEIMSFQESGGDMLGDAEEAARMRAQLAKRMQDVNKPGENPQKPENEMTDEERQQRNDEQEMQEMLEKSLASIEKKIDDPKTSSEQRQKLEQMAKNMQRMLDQMGQGSPDTEKWERITESDKAKELIRALASGRPIPDEQWNKLLSTLDDGLWQVRGRTPPEDYRKAIEQYQDRIRQLMNTVGAE